MSTSSVQLMLPLAFPWAALAGIETAEPPDAREAQETASSWDAPALVPPRLLQFEEASYPPGLDAGEARVQLYLLIDENGIVEEARVLEGASPFAEAALAAVRHALFSPALEGGRPTAVEMPFEYVFPSPPIHLVGQARLRSGGEALPYLLLEIGDRQVMTGPDGRFEVRNLVPGPATIRGLDPSYRVEPISVVILPGERVEVEVDVEPSTWRPELLGVYARRRTPSVRRSLSDAEVRTTPGTLGDPVRAVQNLAGTVRTPLDAGWMLIRGGDPKDTGLYVDGVRVPLVFHLMGFTSVFHPAMIERVDFYPGASDVRYGRATSGAVDLVSRGPEDAVREARLGADVLLASAWTGLRLGDDSTFSAAVRRSWLDAALAGVASLGLFGLEEGAEQVAPRFWDWQLRHDRPKIGILAFGTTDSLNARLSGEGEGDVVYEVGTQHLHLRYDARPAGLRLRVTPVLGTEWQRVVYNAFQDERRRYVGGGRVEILDPGATPVGWSAGVDVEAGRFEMAVTTEERSRLAREAGFFSADPYVDLRFGVDPTLVLGLRFEDLFVGDQLPRGMPSPRVQGRMPLTRVGDADLGAFAAAGVYHGWPLLDQVVGLPAGPYLALERSVSGELGLRASTPRLSVETSFFHRRLQNTTMTEDDGTLGQGEGRAWGIESLLRWTRDDWNGWISHTYGESLRREDPASAWEPSLYDQPHNLVVVMARDLGRGWVLSSRFRYASGYPVPEGTSEGSDLLTGRGVCLTDLSAEPGVDCPDPVRGERLPAFHALDVKVSREIIFRRWALDAYLDVQNLYNRRVPEPVITGAIDLANPYSVGLPILPLLGLQARTRW